jgi:hypothetical protein
MLHLATDLVYHLVFDPVVSLMVPLVIEFVKTFATLSLNQSAEWRFALAHEAVAA